MSRRAQIKMTPDEVVAYLAEQRVANIATIGPNGRPHLAPVWYVPRDTGLATWTYGSSQKVANLRRLAQATVLVEDGDSYERLTGVSMECDVSIIEDPAEVLAIGTGLTERYSGLGAGNGDAQEFLRAQASKRVGLVCTPTKVVSWDHRKLAGVY
ncbi:PPOX class probable F420-dependent enzyme [Tamaricihabitans halophyticus]|uniref:PPOX class probable F420-dependent enzyme n=1 Tax=Tamaricihabitans halophyticus TaxID=1262583 RepID=A0A4R2QYL2_9PSEU|nr:pyridoxamine 5'-phosphate oxidase family protein [Tamaricihabitans halophyticus]TCP54138.1 PPOX class probable F420-dependent enzyme [Tamaricihabitans halophyticus]